ncbi:26S proteasome non-ATPase regulatory subunit 12 [Orchesella cincta]|uniref:26S proteasome non-ATPase regulatory subunit 12 n=1 Tax=Orchesella cincta TaxID=48709 RepID=A0A1D2MMM0_ORCCI|nr:26S proteasome non-ATPase regulatory subunit 12 [Orchesella cincta]
MLEKDPVPVGTGEVVKMEVDYSKTCDEKIPELEALAKSGKLDEALEGLTVLEKQTRTGGDMISTGRVLISVVQLCSQAKKYDLLNEQISTFAKRRGQLKQAVVKMVQEVCNYIDDLPSKELQYQLIETLRSVTEGKIYVEVERARLTHRFAKMKEAEGDITTAATILQELQVETYGSMEKIEKVGLILEQMRLCLAKQDYIRTQIISKKINVKFFESTDDEIQTLKSKFYMLMIQSDQHDGNFLSICRHFRAMIHSPLAAGEVDKTKQEELKHFQRSAAVYLALSPYDNEQSDLLHRMLEEKSMEDIPTYKSLLELFKNQELIHWKQFCQEYEAELRGQVNAAASTGIFDNSEGGNKRWENLKDRVVEHNIRIMAKYYTRVTLERMSVLLDLSKDKVEEVLCNMVVAAQVQGKIDRPSGIVSFQATKDPSELLNDWSHNLNTLMTLIQRTTHLINKEEMVHKHLLAGGATKPAGPSTSTDNVPSPMEVDS